MYICSCYIFIHCTGRLKDEDFNAHAVYAGDNAVNNSRMTAGTLDTEKVCDVLATLFSRYGMTSTATLLRARTQT